MSFTITPPEAATTSPVPARGPARPARRLRLGLLRRWVSPLALIALWQLLSSVGVLDERTLAAPSRILETGVEYVQNGVLPEAILASLQRVGIGFVLGAVVAIAFALVAGLSRLGEDAIDPPMQMLRTLPHFGMVSLFITWMGLGEQPRIALIAMGVVFPLYLNTFAGIRSIDRKTIEAARSMHLSRVQLIRHVILPGALPQTLVGLRQSLGIAWLSLIVAETISP